MKSLIETATDILTEQKSVIKFDSGNYGRFTFTYNKKLYAGYKYENSTWQFPSPTNLNNPVKFSGTVKAADALKAWIKAHESFINGYRNHMKSNPRDYS